MKKTTIIATGDAFMTRRLGECPHEGFDDICRIISRHDVKFNNLEFTAHDHEGYPAAFSGGTWAMSEPEMLDDLKRYGFNLFNAANNHSLDYSHGGLLATMRHLREREMPFAGIGSNLAEASAPVYVDTSDTRVALIAVTASFHDSDMAGNESKDVIGRPGVNPLRVETIYHIEEHDYAVLKEIIAKTGINEIQDDDIRTGYALPLPEGKLNFGGIDFVLDTKTEKHTAPFEKDMQRILDSIHEAKQHADVVLVSIHFHDFRRNTEIPPEYMELFSRRCIDGGADAILGHGPHEVQAIEMYHGKPIFYSLGNFIFQTETVAVQPAEAYENAGLPPTTTVAEYMNHRSQNGTRGYAVQESIWRSIMASFTVEDGRITQIKLYPLTLGMGQPIPKLGNPRLADNAVLHYLAELSKSYGTDIAVYDHYALVTL